MNTDLSRFTDAQKSVYPTALEELRRGRKTSHWMWFVFPQIAGLGVSETAKFYAIRDRQEAEDYLADPVLGLRLRESFDAILAINDRTAREIFGDPDDLKLRSCATLFAAISPGGSPFHQVLDHYFGGRADPRTLALLK
jgi:uncharacterized protein (DUF1810 family)